MVASTISAKADQGQKKELPSPSRPPAQTQQTPTRGQGISSHSRKAEQDIATTAPGGQIMLEKQKVIAVIINAPSASTPLTATKPLASQPPRGKQDKKVPGGDGKRARSRSPPFGVGGAPPGDRRRKSTRRRLAQMENGAESPCSEDVDAPTGQRPEARSSKDIIRCQVPLTAADATDSLTATQTAVPPSEVQGGELIGKIDAPRKTQCDSLKGYDMKGHRLKGGGTGKGMFTGCGMKCFGPGTLSGGVDLGEAIDSVEDYEFGKGELDVHPKSGEPRTLFEAFSIGFPTIGNAGHDQGFVYG